MRLDVNKMVRLAVLSALSIVLMVIIRFPLLPAAPYLEYEPADVPILVGTFMYGPIAGLLMTVVVSLIQALTVSSGSGWVGLVMHVIATGTFVIVAGVVYQRMHTFVGAILALILGSLSMTAIMIPSNLFFTVKFWGYPYETVEGMILPILMPFNLLKAGINSVITLALYKSLRWLLKDARRKSVSAVK